MKRYGNPKVVVWDKLRTYGAAMKAIGNVTKQETGRRLNDLAEISYLPFRPREREDIVLLAPNAFRSSGWSLPEDMHFVAQALLEDASQHHPIDRENVILVGHSMGGKFALRLANFGPGHWNAVAGHAASLWRNSIWPARHPVPIHLQVGEGDTLFPPGAVRKTMARLAGKGRSRHDRASRRWVRPLVLCLGAGTGAGCMDVSFGLGHQVSIENSSPSWVVFAEMACGRHPRSERNLQIAVT